MSARPDDFEPLDARPIRRALVSVYDKTGLIDLARALADAGVEIVSTGSTASRIAEAGLAVTPVDRVTGFPEILEGRVKTLHPSVHAGILADQRKPGHRAQLADLGIAAFDLVVCNLYPFERTAASGAGFDECVEQIDIGGPSMVREEPPVGRRRHLARALRRGRSRGRGAGVHPGAAPRARRRGLRPHGRLRPGHRRVVRALPRARGGGR